MPRRTPRLFAPIALCAVAVAALSGCTPAADPTPSSSATTVTPTATASATTLPTPTASPTPVTIGCSTLISPDAIYAFNPNFSLITSWTPAAGSAAATAASESGLACRWQNDSSNDSIDISVAHLDENSIEALKNVAVTEGTLVPTYGDEAYFNVAKGVGTAVVFQGNYWLVATSVDFAEPGDPADLVDAALSALN